MQLPESIACQLIEIRQPRWHDRMVLIAAHKVGAHNKIMFSDAPTLAGEWYISGRDIHMCELKPKANGVIDCYLVPLKFLEPLERTPRSAKQGKLRL